MASVPGPVQNLFNRPKSWAGAANLQPGQRHLREFFLEDIITNETTRMGVIYVKQLIQNTWLKPDPIVPLPWTYLNYINITKQILPDNKWKAKRTELERICVIKSKARKTNLFNAMVKEAKVKDFAVLFLALSWFHQGIHKKLSFNINFQRAHWLIFAETFFYIHCIS